VCENYISCPLLPLFVKCCGAGGEQLLVIARHLRHVDFAKLLMEVTQDVNAHDRLSTPNLFRASHWLVIRGEPPFPCPG
jgi:hypothetical protein